MLKLLVLLSCVSVLGYRHTCDKKTVLEYAHISTYDFSVRLLDRISQETGGHFVFSPISTWLQLLNLADGAKGKTLNEILKITRLQPYRFLCLRKFVKGLFNSLNDESRITMKHSSIFLIDKLLNVKRSFIRNVQRYHAARVVSENFRTSSESAEKVNKIIRMDTNDTIIEAIDADDFNRTVLLLIDAACLKANWRNPFNPVYTKLETFYSYENVPVGKLYMMQQTGYFNVTYIPVLNSHALELPFSDRLTMLLFLPRNGTAADLYWIMRKIRLQTIFKFLKSSRPKLVTVKLPRFKVTTDFDNIPELLYDMGIQRMFIPRNADLRRISDYRVYVSMMLNKVDIEVTETGVTGKVGPDSLFSREVSFNISFNQPFAYLIVDKITNVIIFAGIYSKPSVF